MSTEENDCFQGILRSMNHENGTAIKIAKVRSDMPTEDSAQLALRGCAYWVREREEGLEHPNTIVVGGGRALKHSDLHNQTFEMLRGRWLSIYENPNVIHGFYTFSGFFVPRNIAMWCALHIVEGLKPAWQRRSAFTELQSDGVLWDAHKKAWDEWQKELKETATQKPST